MTMTATSSGRLEQVAARPRTVAWRFKTAGTVAIWIGCAAALFVTAFIAGTGGVDATRFNTPGLVGAALILALAGGCFAASWLTQTPVAPAPGPGWGEVEEIDDLDAIALAVADR